MSRFIKYLASLISEDIDLDSSGKLLSEADPQERELERLAALGDEEAAAKLIRIKKRRGAYPPDVTFDEAWEMYCTLVGSSPEDFNRPEVNPDSTQAYEELIVRFPEINQQFTDWLYEDLGLGPEIPKPGFTTLAVADLFQELWEQREYLGGKFIFYVSDRGLEPDYETYEIYNRARRPNIERLEAKLRKFFREPE